MSGTRKIGGRGYKVCCDPLPDFKHKKRVTGKLYQLRKELIQNVFGLDLIEGMGMPQLPHEIKRAAGWAFDGNVLQP